MSEILSIHLFRRLRAAVASGLLIAVALATPAAARTVVDPSTLNPAPPDSFNAVCYQNGNHITCTLSFTEPAVVNEPTDIFCDDTRLLASETRSVVGKRLYDADGNLLQRHFRESVTGSFLNPPLAKLSCGASTTLSSRIWKSLVTSALAPPSQRTDLTRLGTRWRHHPDRRRTAHH